jgi:dCTP deaminase
MVLTDTEIKKALEAGRLKIDPPPQEGQWDTTSVDLHLGSQFHKWSLADHEEAVGEPLVVRVDKYTFTKLARRFLTEVKPDPDGCIVLGRGDFYLAVTEEKVEFCPGGGLAGRVEGKSSLARLGLSVHFAPTIHNEFRGPIILELHNAGPAALKLCPGAKICQLIVETIQGTPTGSMEGKQFQDQTSPAGTPPA